MIESGGTKGSHRVGRGLRLLFVSSLLAVPVACMSSPPAHSGGSEGRTTGATQATSEATGSADPPDGGSDAGVDASTDGGPVDGGIAPEPADAGPARPTVTGHRGGYPVLWDAPHRASCQPGRHRPARQNACSQERPCRGPATRRGATPARVELACLPPGASPQGGRRQPSEVVFHDVDGCAPGEIVAALPVGANYRTVCRPDCRAPANACPPESVCFADGLCRRDCREHGCGPNTTCTDGGDGWHYCVRARCERTRDCTCGTCVAGYCHDAPGHCVSAEPRP